MPPKKKRKPRARARGQTGARAAQSPAARPETPDPNEKRRERIQQRREEKAKQQAAAMRRYRMRRVIRLLTFAAVIAFGVWFFFLRQQIPDAIAGNRIEDFDTLASESRANQLHTTQPVTYESVPPVSGQHNPNPAPCGTYASEIPEENMVHTLEHGAVGILYHPDQLEVAQIRTLEGIVGDYETHVFSAPYPQQENPITMVAWAHLMRLDSIEGEAITEFIDVFREGGDAPEEQDCPKSSDAQYEPQPSPTATPPAPGATDSAGGGGDGGDGGGGGNDGGGGGSGDQDDAGG